MLKDLKGSLRPSSYIHYFYFIMLRSVVLLLLIFSQHKQVKKLNVLGLFEEVIKNLICDGLI
jgi:Na+/H+ antiporter NhaC